MNKDKLVLKDGREFYFGEEYLLTKEGFFEKEKLELIAFDIRKIDSCYIARVKDENSVWFCNEISHLPKQKEVPESLEEIWGKRFTHEFYLAELGIGNKTKLLEKAVDTNEKIKFFEFTNGIRICQQNVKEIKARLIGTTEWKPLIKLVDCVD